MDRTSFDQTLDLVQEALGDRYLVTGPLAQGGMSLLLRGRQTLLDQPVAIKVMHAQAVGNRALRERFLREARILASLQAPQVSRVYDAGALKDGRLYLVMELLQGENLEAISERGPMSLGLAARVLMQVCDGLIAAHDKGIIHRDLKPENVFIIAGDDGQPCAKLIDFGIAKDTADQKDVTGTYTIVGSPLYVPPEQIASSRTVDKRADIWAMGIMLYQLVLQRHPFEDPSLALLLNKIQNEPLPPFPSDSDPMFEIIVERCLAKQPEDRYPTASELKEALSSLADQEPTDHDEDMPTLGPRPAPVVAPAPAAAQPAPVRAAPAPAPAAPAPARRIPVDHRQEPDVSPGQGFDDSQPISSTENTLQTNAPAEAAFSRTPISSPDQSGQRAESRDAQPAPRERLSQDPAPPRINVSSTLPSAGQVLGSRPRVLPLEAQQAQAQARQAQAQAQQAQAQQAQAQQAQAQAQQAQAQQAQAQAQAQQAQAQAQAQQAQAQAQQAQAQAQQAQAQAQQAQQQRPSVLKPERIVQRTIPIGRPMTPEARALRGNTVPLLPGNTPPPSAAVASASSRSAPVFAEPLPPPRGQVPTVIVARPRALWPFVALGVGIVLVVASIAFALTR